MSRSNIKSPSGPLQRPDAKTAGIYTVQQHIMEQQREHPTATGEFSWLLSAVTLATKVIASYVQRAGLMDVIGAEGSENVQGELVQKLDLIANEALMHTLGYRGNVGIIASEEDADPKVLQEAGEGGHYIVMFDPLDGSSNIDTCVPIGTIFTIFRNPAIRDRDAKVLQPGTRQVGAGYVLYGSSTVLVYTTGQGVHAFTLDPSIGAFVLTRENIKMPARNNQYSVNEGYFQTFPQEYQDYLKWAKSEEGGSSSLRYIGSLVADFHRILFKGGVFMYPPTAKNPDGKLRLMYECNPLAYIAEQAGGMATDGKEPIMDIQPEALHERTPLIIGSKENVEDVMKFVNK